MLRGRRGRETGNNGERGDNGMIGSNGKSRVNFIVESVKRKNEGDRVDSGEIYDGGDRGVRKRL